MLFYTTGCLNQPVSYYPTIVLKLISQLKLFQNFNSEISMTGKRDMNEACISLTLKSNWFLIYVVFNSSVVFLLLLIV